MYRDILIFSGTIFGSSIALSTGKQQDLFFYWGEIVLFLSVLCSLISLWTKISGDYWFHFLTLKFQIQSDLNLNQDIMDDFERNVTKDQLSNYDMLLEKNKFFTFLFRIVKIEWIQSAGMYFAIIGTFLLLISL